MKRFTASDSLDAFISMCQSKDEKGLKNNQVCSREFQAMIDSLEEEDYREEASQATEKKRRLSLNQVKALEKNFEVENKLEPDRKAKLSEELGLQPRQIAVWFQNRRARLKTKELERDYGLLKSSYDALKLDYNNLEQEHEALKVQLSELKSKLSQENEESSQVATAEVEEETPVSEQSKNQSGLCDDVNAQLLISSPASSTTLHFTGSSSSSLTSMNWVQLSDPRTTLSNHHHHHHHQQSHFVKLEEQSLFNSDSSCNFFSVDQPPTLQWYFTGQ
ncbi:hypothetical protein Ddye_006342 [Dipteronia dyeriana]|uniref:Homeobox-leucine zipper protein n=1 Tax=Dipteronia dyeriana TaxID=168575 RepID=A0AAD9XI05_9ROSI|nr:hypothetical protein Ddye_006342 [Dipteronia dyeriana]